MKRTIEVYHEGSHAPTSKQIEAALGVVLLDEGLKRKGDYVATSVVTSSGGPSKYVVEFEAEERAPKAPRKTAAAKRAETSPKPEPSEPVVNVPTSPAE